MSVRGDLFPMWRDAVRPLALLLRDACSHLPVDSAVGVPLDTAIPLYAALSADANERGRDLATSAVPPSRGNIRCKADSIASVVTFSNVRAASDSSATCTML